MVSVILPFYNAKETLARAIGSILAQTFQDFELILVDNNSTDRSVEIARVYKESNANVHLFSEKEQGVVAAMNKGLTMAKRPWVARMDADDEWKPQKLESQFEFLERNPKIDVLGTQVEFVSCLLSEGHGAYVEWSNSIISSQEISRSIFQEMPIVNPSVVFRQELIEKFGNYKKGDFPEDYEMFLRWHRNGAKMAKVKKELMFWYDSNTRLTRTNSAYSLEAFNRIKCKYLAFWLTENNPFYPAIWIWGAGRKTRKKAEELEKYGIKIEGYVDINENKTSQAPCVHFSAIAASDKRFIISFVSNRGKGNEIRTYLLNKGFREGLQFVMAG